MSEDVSVINIREYLETKNSGELKEEELQGFLAGFSCEKNTDVEKFLKERAIEFTKKNQSVTYLVFSDQDASLVGYFTIAIKPISVDGGKFSNTVRRKISRVSEAVGKNGTYTLSAYLIAQLGKNFMNRNDQKISGRQLLQAAMEIVRELQRMAGGMVVFIETENKEKLLDFYECNNGFKKFDVREAKTGTENAHMLVQLLKVL